MNSILVGMFDTQAAAQAAHSQLLAAGFAPEDVAMTGGGMAMGSGNEGSLAAEAAPVTSTTHEHGGTISNFFARLFGEDDDATDRGMAGHYDEAFRRGHYSVTVTTTDGDVDRAEQILNGAGAIDIDERAQQWRSEGWTGGTDSSMGSMASGAADLTGSVGAAGPASDRDLSNRTGMAGTTGAAGVTGATQTLQEVEEQLKVGKRVVARGGVRVFTRVVEVPVEESVRLREEQADIQRRVVDRPATEADFNAFKEGSIEVRNTSEEAVVSKSARVVGEVEIGKRVTERDEVVSDKVRKTQVEVEQLTEGTGTSAAGSTALPGSAGSARLAETTGLEGSAGTAGSVGASGQISESGPSVIVPGNRP